ncbi:MAG TPA: hypothetical protein VMT28_06375 [Terriglobales bacterium]|nr:hypothetical protein [Terriglobales bacterium]
MSTTREKLITWAAILCLLHTLLAAVAGATTPTAPATQATSTDNKSKSAKSESAAPSAQEIAAAKASHKVWVNLSTGIYHKRGRWYGKTKNGKFMTEDEAKKAGYKAAKRE